MGKRKVAYYEKTIHDIDQQILILSEKKEQERKKKQELLLRSCFSSGKKFNLQFLRLEYFL